MTLGRPKGANRGANYNYVLFTKDDDGAVISYNYCITITQVSKLTGVSSRTINRYLGNDDYSCHKLSNYEIRRCKRPVYIKEYIPIDTEDDLPEEVVQFLV
tara:strand:+ start:1810 stop:2112 length:303 start_codon:yes stop_codon:yes gene_type:complete